MRADTDRWFPSGVKESAVVMMLGATLLYLLSQVPVVGPIVVPVVFINAGVAWARSRLQLQTAA